MENKKKFRQWLIDAGKPGAAHDYPSAVSRVSDHYAQQTGKAVPIYEIANATEISRIAGMYGKDGKFAEFGSKHNARNRNAVARYAEFFVGLNDADNVAQPSGADGSQRQDDEQQSNFKYEHDLQTAFCAQIASLFPNYEILGQEYPVGGKRIDVLLEHSEKGNLLVVELKSGTAEPSVFGQISMYIGMLSQLPKFSGKEIRGIIVAGGVADGLLYACYTNPNILVKTYRMSIELEDSDLPDVENESE